MFELYDFCFFVLLFFIYSFLGYCVEVVSISFKEKKLILSRGYLIGPYLPIFGLSSFLMLAFLNRYHDDIFTLFIMSAVICCTFEYLTSIALEKIFNLRWWDYSSRKYNIDGRVCLENGVLFGFGGFVLIRFLHPFVCSILFSFSKTVILVLGECIFFILFVDFLLSTYTIFQLKNNFSVYTSGDSTIQIRREILKSFQQYRFFHNRLFKAFPRLESTKDFLEKKGKRKNKKEKNSSGN